jgi:hypothetical protein
LIWGLVIKLAEIALPPIIQAVVNHYSKKEQTPEVTEKLQAHQTALNALKGPTP